MKMYYNLIHNQKDNDILIHFYQKIFDQYINLHHNHIEIIKILKHELNFLFVNNNFHLPKQKVNVQKVNNHQIKYQLIITTFTPGYPPNIIPFTLLLSTQLSKFTVVGP